MHEHAEHISGTHQAAVKQGQARKCHEQDQRSSYSDPGGIGSIHRPLSFVAKDVASGDTAQGRGKKKQVPQTRLFLALFAN
jgi:hypothetical protein